MTGGGGVGLRLGLFGATGALGREVLAVLEERKFPLRSFRAFATAASTGEAVEIGGEVIPVESDPTSQSLRGLDLMLICTPPGVALDWVREALRAEVPCIDCSGALANSPEVPLLMADLCASSAPMGQPAVATPTGPTLAWALVLAALDRTLGVKRVVGTVLQSAAHAGRAGIEQLSGETIALLNQSDPPDASPFARQVAFDCVPASAASAATAASATRTASSDEPGGSEESANHGQSAGERGIARELARLLDRPLAVAVTVIQVPTFVADGSALSVEVASAPDPAALDGLFEKAPGVELWDGDVGPTTRDTAGCDTALVGRLRVDPSVERGLQLWVVADALRLAAVNAVKLAEARLQIQ